MTTLHLKSVLVVFLFAFITTNTSAQSESEQLATDFVDYSHVPGSFHFESPTDNMFFWKTSFIESLYSDIESFRLDDEIYRWQFSNDMVIVIYPKSYINSTEYTPNTSPYNSTEKL